MLLKNAMKEESSPSIHVVKSPTAGMPGPRANGGSDMTFEEQPCGFYKPNDVFKVHVV